MKKKRNCFKYRPGRDCMYMERYLDRDTISAKEYNRFLKILKREEVKAALGAHKISIIRNVMLKYNKAGGTDMYKQPAVLSGCGPGRYGRRAYMPPRRKWFSLKQEKGK